MRWRARADAWGGNEALFSAKSFAAAVLAYYVALRIGLDRPYWAVITSYIIAQPLAGAVSSKAVFRLLGTVIGAAVAILLVPALGNAPELLVLALAVWLGLCTYVALLDRTPRAYVFLLAGYTAGIIALPVVEAPATIFTVASLRAQEIGIGIASATLVHSVVFPRTVAARLYGRIDTIIADAERWSRDALSRRIGDGQIKKDRQQLALDVHELHQLGIHHYFERGQTRLMAGALRALQSQLCLLLPLASAVEDRRQQLILGDALPPPVGALLDDVGAWLEHGPGSYPQADPQMLLLRTHGLEPALPKIIDWTCAIQLSLLDRLRELIEVHILCRELASASTGGATALSDATLDAIRHSRKRALHRDHGLAFRGALATFMTVIVGCTVWIATAWPQGASAVVLASIICALFSNLDDPNAVTWQVWQGICGAAVVATLYAFAILPKVSDFPVLIAVLAPAFLIIGTMMVVRRTAAMAIGIILTFPGLVGLDSRYTTTFDPFINTALAQVLGGLLAVIMLHLIRSVGVERVARRMVAAGWRDLARRTDARRAPDTVTWINMMLDRIALLTPRLVERQGDAETPLLDILKDARVGIALDELHRFRAGANLRDSRLVAVVLKRTKRYFSTLSATQSRPLDPGLARAIGTAIVRIGQHAPAGERRRAILALTSLGRNIFPDAIALEGLSSR
jgi:uncharacterized membrane protein YccC